MSAAPALPASDAPAESVLLGGKRLAFVDEGPRDAPAVLMVHGIPGSVRDFRYLVPHLTDRVRAVRIDLPGFGDSEPTASGINTLSGRAEVLVALADHLRLPRFAVLGHSMGGAACLAAAARHPERVSLLALVASVALSAHRGLGLSPRAFKYIAVGLRTPLVRRLLVAPIQEAYRRRGFPLVPMMDAEALSLQLRSISAVDFRLMRRMVAGPLPPTLLAYARDDHMVETWISEELSAALPRARVLAFDSGGHNLQKSRAAEVAGAVKECLFAGEPTAAVGRP